MPSLTLVSEAKLNHSNILVFSCHFWCYEGNVLKHKNLACNDQNLVVKTIATLHEFHCPECNAALRRFSQICYKHPLGLKYELVRT